MIGENVKEIKSEAFVGIASGSALEVNKDKTVDIKIESKDIIIAEDAFANAYNSLVFYVTDSVKAFLQSVEEIYKGKIDWIYKTLEEWED